MDFVLAAAGLALLVVGLEVCLAEVTRFSVELVEAEAEAEAEVEELRRAINELSCKRGNAEVYSALPKGRKFLLGCRSSHWMKETSEGEMR